MDVDDYRNIWEITSGISLPSERYNVFYDETGNVRKFRLTENGVNADEGVANDFILGGVFYKGDTIPCDLDLLYEELKIKAAEIKFKTLAGRGADFWTAIGRNQFSNILNG